jgi:sugar phosphate isomerase/epimerase
VRIGSSHLSYCTNIHPGESWDEIRGNLARHLPQVKRRVCPGAPFGVGLRLSALAARSLTVPETLAQFVDFLRQNDLYVFTINGFPYGPFHGTRVKEGVYLPDWRDEARLEYTNTLADLLAALLPSEGDHVGSISTVPGAFKPNATTPQAVAQIADMLIRHVAHLVGLERKTGRTIVLGLEPEPCCLLETVAETVAFFRDHLYSRRAAATLAALAGLERHEAEAALRRHLGACLDLCHAAVEFEDPAECLDTLASAGIPIAKIQVTAGLRIAQVTADSVKGLQGFDDGVYLHQVVERASGALHRYVDIDAACASDRWRSGHCEWRVHFHVPVYVEDLDGFSSTQPFVRAALALHRQRSRTPHLEVETYTWSVLPAHARDVPIDEAIARELLWVQKELA